MARGWWWVRHEVPDGLARPSPGASRRRPRRAGAPPPGLLARSAWAWFGLLAILVSSGRGLHAQEETEIARPGPPASEDFEADADGDQLPVGWYNIRDARLAKDGVVGDRCLRFDNDLPGRPARASRAFGVDGRESGALLVGLWVNAESILPGERVGEDPRLMITFFDEQLRPVAQRTMGPWSERNLGDGWVHVRGRMAVPPSARDAILTVGLFGATGTLQVDGMTFELEPRAGVPSANLLLNGGFELGDPAPDGWELSGGVRRSFPGHQSDSALAISSAGARAEAGIAVPVHRFRGLELRLDARGAGLRASGGAYADVAFLDAHGQAIAGTPRLVPTFRWAGSFDWRPFRATVAVPSGAYWGIFRVHKVAPAGTLQIDDVEIAAAPDADAGTWTPYHVAEPTDAWSPYESAGSIEPGSALDASFLLEAPAGSSGRVVVAEGRLRFDGGGPARFFGVSLLPPLAFVTPERADALADRLARSGVNLVRLGAIDTPIGPGLGLFDDSREDTSTFDPLALPRFDHLVAALKERGIYAALEIQSRRRFRRGDDLAGSRGLPPGGGPAAAFDPRIRKLTLDTARSLLGHDNAETGLPMRDDPALAWVALAGELSLFDLIDDPEGLPQEVETALREEIQQSRLGAGRRAWQALEADQWRAEADALRAFGLQAPIAGSSHWRREPEFVAAQAGTGLDLIDDRLYWSPPRWAPPGRKSMLWDAGRSLVAAANRKRRADTPYIVGEWAAHTNGAWALPYEGADLILMAALAASNGWDALVRRGVTPDPEVWGAAAPGTSGENDLFIVPESINGMPPTFALLPHAASIVLRSGESPPRLLESAGRLAVETRHTQVLAGWAEGRSVVTDALELESFSDFAVLAVTAIDGRPILESNRLLVTLVGRSVPTGLLWADHWRREVADPGRPPMLMEPVRGRLTWKRGGPAEVRAFALNNDGSRARPVPGDVRAGGSFRIDLDAGPTLHWELTRTGD